MKTLILGYGNTLRKDDGLGVYVALALASLTLPNDVDIRTYQQLSPELSPLLAQMDHAIFIDAERFLDKVPKEEYQAQTLAIELYTEGGIRSVEIGALMADRDPVTRENRFPDLEMVRLAVPRRVYTNNHMDYIAAVAGNLFERRDKITRGVRIRSEARIMRHFTVELERL